MIKQKSQSNTSNQGEIQLQKKKVMLKYQQIKVCEAKQHFTQWLRNLPLQERYLAVKVNCLELLRELRKAYRKLESEKNPQNEGLLKGQHSWGKKFPSKSIKSFFDGIVLTSETRYLDSIGFDFGFIDQPEKIFDSLTYFFKQKDTETTLSDLNQNSYTLQDCIQGLKAASTMADLAISICKMFRGKLFARMIVGEKTSSWEQEKSRKRQFTEIWKNSSEQLKNSILLLGKHDMKELIMGLLDKKLPIPNPFQMEKYIEDLAKMDKNQFCNRIFKSRLRKNCLIYQGYHELVFQRWEQEVMKKRKKKSKKSKKKKTKGKSNKSFESNETNETQYPSQLAQKVNLQQITQLKIQDDIISFSDYISELSNQSYSRKVQAFGRIQFLLSVYFQTSITLFGSSACGLAINSSDIDIAINEMFLFHFSYLPDHQKLSIALEYLAEFLRVRSWIKNIKVIGTSAIPIITLTVDTSISMMEQYMSEYDSQRLNSCTDKGLVDVDLTVEIKSQIYGSCHLGIISTTKICEWINEIQSLHQIALILKYYLTKKCLNNTYSGGLKTYTLIVMIIAYIIHNGLQKSSNIALIFEGLSQFYGYSFDETKEGIDLSRKDSIFYKKNKAQKNSADLEIKDPINGKVITKNCYSFALIKQMMRQIHHQCFQRNGELVQEYCSNQKIEKCSPQQIIEDLKKVHPINVFTTI